MNEPTCALISEQSVDCSLNLDYCLRKHGHLPERVSSSDVHVRCPLGAHLKQFARIGTWRHAKLQRGIECKENTEANAYSNAYF